MNPTSSLVRSNACQAAFVFLCLGLLRANAAQAPASMISIWPGKPPGTESWTQQEEWYGDAMDGAVQGLHVRNTTTPGLSVYAAPRQIANGTAVIVAPGGGFTSEAWEKEGTLLAEWLQTKGVTSFVLKYRLTPQSAGGATAARICCARWTRVCAATGSRRMASQLLAPGAAQRVREA